jgi:hypothetical protein
MVLLSGVWNLISFDYLINGTSILQPNGPHPLGKIAIMPEGYLSVQITTPEAAVPIPNDVKWGDATDEAIAAIARPYVSYCGSYNTSYVGEQLVITTSVDVALDPSWMTRPQVRNVTFVEENGKQYMILNPVGTIPMTLPVSSSFQHYPVSLTYCFTNSKFPKGNITGDVLSVLKWEKEINTCRKGDAVAR